MVGLVRNGAGILLKRFGGPMQVDVTDAEYKVLEPGTVSFVNHIQLSSAGEYSFEVMVKDLLSGTVSNDQQTINLPSPGESSFSLSTILLSKEVDKSVSTRDPFLTVQGVRILPSARCQFRNGEDLIFYFDIYNAQAGSDGKKSDVSIELSLMREGRLVNARLPSYHLNEDSDQTSHITFSRFLHLAGLPPGSYSLVIEVRDNLGKYSARGQAAFSLVN
jgi:hypothetical protein